MKYGSTMRCTGFFIFAVSQLSDASASSTLLPAIGEEYKSVNLSQSSRFMDEDNTSISDSEISIKKRLSLKTYTPILARFSESVTRRTIDVLPQNQQLLSRRRTSLADPTTVCKLPQNYYASAKRNSLTAAYEIPKSPDYRAIAPQRVNIIKVMFEQLREQDTYKAALIKQETQLEDCKAEMQAELSKYGMDLGESPSFINNEDSLVNRMTFDDVLLYANISTAIYDIKPEILNSDNTASKKLEKKPVTTDEAFIRVLTEIREDTIKKVIASTKKDELPKMREDLVHKLSSMILPQVNTSMPIYDILKSIDVKLEQLGHVSVFDIPQKNSQSIEDTFLKIAQDKFKINNLTCGIEIIHVFLRNHEEFSGIIGYDNSKNKLILAFAGSKSFVDWIKNTKSSGQKLSHNHGLLTGVSIHNGIGSHFDDNFVQFMKFMGSWLHTYNPENKKSTLEVIAVGHSLGGSLAEIYGTATKQIIQKHGIKCNVGIVTFGSPGVIKKFSIDIMNEYINGPGNAIRFVHKNDTIPSIFNDNASLAAVTIMTTASHHKPQDPPFSPTSSSTIKNVTHMKSGHSSVNYYHDSAECYKQWRKNYAAIKAVSITYQFEQDKLIQLQNSIEKINIHLGKLNDLFNQLTHDDNEFSIELNDFIDDKQDQFSKLLAEREQLKGYYFRNDMKPIKLKKSSDGQHISNDPPKIIDFEMLRELKCKIDDLKRDLDTLEEIRRTPLSDIMPQTNFLDSPKLSTSQCQSEQLRLLRTRSQSYINFKNLGVNLIPKSDES